MAPKIITGPITKLDAAESLFLQRELQQIEQRIFETPFGPLQAEQLIPVEWDVDPGAEEYAYDRITGRGMAQWIGAAASDMPRAAVLRTRAKLPMRSMAIAYGYTVQEIRAAKFAGRPLEDLEAKAARRGIDSFRNKVWLGGDTTIPGFGGFYNDATVPVGNATHGSWASASGDFILQDMNDAALDVWSTTKKNFRPNTIALPDAMWGRVQSTARSANVNDTIASYFLRTNPYGITNLIPVTELAGAGVGGTNRMVIYFRDSEVLVAKGSIMFQQYAPQQEGFNIVIPCEGRIGPTHWRTPIAAVYRDGL